MAKIPGFGAEQEMREFWDAHDSTEYFEDRRDDEVHITFKQDGGFWSFLWARNVELIIVDNCRRKVKQCPRYHGD